MAGPSSTLTLPNRRRGRGQPRPGRRAALRTCALSLFAGVPLLLAGCGGSSSSTSSAPPNGVAGKTPAEILASAKAAADGASSAHVQGSLSSGGSTITLDLDLLASRGGRGELAENGLSFELIDVGGFVYIKGSPAFYAHIAGPATAQLFVGKWLKAPATSGNFASLASLTNLRSLISTALAGHGTLARGKTATVLGQQVIALEDTTKGGTLYVSTKGKAYPIEVVKGGSTGGEISFSDWNERVALTAPSSSVDLTQLQSGR
jgi:hypothetical protein